MIFEFAEIRCILEVLKLLNKNESKYSTMFRETKVSHTTLQPVLKELNEKDFINKHDVGHMKVDYEITDRGNKLLKLLTELKQLVN
ncbi:hypothetical protein CMI42_03205 [Candidatus Pacearchaeota archaeon]|nr:hypothetical protein [Candidatus Pacearchaeota archaeon]|tara:strand:+ start:157 stop:414 length:258 start_codon:yes stop_codon:yes gene_type:complete